MSNHEHHHHEDECCAHEAAPTEITLNASAAGNLQTTLQVAGIDCAEEVSLIQRALKPLGGVREVRVNIMSGKTIIAHDETITPEVLIKVIGDAGLKAIREGEKAGDEVQQRQKQRLLSVSISGAFTLLGLLMHWTHSAPQSVALGCFLMAIISGGWFIAPKAIAAVRRFAPDMNLLMSIAVLGAAGIGEWSEGAAVAFLFALSELLESFSVARARRAIQSLLKLAPESALLKNGDRFEEVPVEKVHVGDIIAVKSGARVPLDGAGHEWHLVCRSGADYWRINASGKKARRSGFCRDNQRWRLARSTRHQRLLRHDPFKDHSPRRGGSIAESILTTVRGCVCEILHAIGDGIGVARFPPPTDNFRCSLGCLVLPQPW